MKTLVEPKITVTGDSITICAKIKEMPFNGFLSTRVSHFYLHPDHLAYPRRVQSSNQAVFVESPDAKFAIPNDVVIAIAAASEPLVTFAPKFKRGVPLPKVQVISETPHSLQWQISDSALGDFKDIEGATTDTLDETKVEKGKWVQCVVTNATGKTTTPPAEKT
jgi:hypothetical protein